MLATWCDARQQPAITAHRSEYLLRMEESHEKNPFKPHLRPAVRTRPAGAKPKASQTMRKIAELADRSGLKKETFRLAC